MSRGYIRKPSLKRRIGAYKASYTRKLKKKFIPFYGQKGTGFWKNPSKWLYNKIYYRTSMSVDDLVKEQGEDKFNWLLFILLFPTGIFPIVQIILYFLKKRK